MAKCSKTKKQASDIGEAVENQEALIEERINKDLPNPHFAQGADGKKFFGWIGARLVQKHGFRNDPWTQKEWREVVKEAFESEESGGKGLLAKYPGMNINTATLALEIMSIINDKPWLQDIVSTMYWELLSEWKPNINSVSGEIDLATLPMSTLKVIYAEVAYVASAQDGGGNVNGIMGYFRVKLNTPTELAKHYGSESYYNLGKALSKYNERITYIINDFMKKPKNLIIDKKRSNRKYGMENIYTRIRDFSQEIDPAVIDESDIEDGMVALFTRMAIGWVYLDKKTNELMIYSEYKGTGKVYDSTGDPIFAFMNPIPISEYTEDNTELDDLVRRKIRIDSLGKVIKTIWESIDESKHEYIMHGTKTKSGMLDLVEQYKVIDYEAFIFANREIANTAKEVMDALVDLFDGVLDAKTIQKIFFDKDYKSTDEYKNLSPENRKTLDSLYSLFTNQSMLRLVQMNSTDLRNNPNFKENHFPVQYLQAGLPDLWNKFIYEMEQELTKLNEELLVATGEARIALKAKRDNYQLSLESAKIVKENWKNDKYGYDAMGDQNLPLAKDNKHIKHVTGAFDIRNMRQDKGAYYSYLRHFASAIERNRLTAELIRGLKKELKPGIRANMINMYKGPFGRPDTVGGIFFWEGSAESYSARLGRMGANVSPQSVHRFFTLFNSAISGRYLGGVGTAIQNFSAAAHSIQDYGMSRVVDAIKTVTNHKESVYEMIDRAGIIDFSDYYSATLVNDLAGMDLENQVQKIILGAMINYHGRIANDSSAKTEAAARAEFEANIQRALEESRMFMDSIIIPDDISEIKQRQGDRRYRKIKSMINKYVDWAITKRFEYNKAMKTGLFDNWKVVAYDKLSNLPRTVQYFFQFGPGKNVTMAESEKAIRILSFVIGIKLAMKEGVIERKAFDRITGEDYEKAIEIGRITARYTNYGMTSQDVGQIAQGDIGNSTVKFKIWWMQNMGKDFKRFKRLYRSLADLSKIDDDKIDWKVVFKIMGTLGTNTRKLRSTNPAAAQFKSWLTMSGLFTLGATVLLLGPIGLPVARGLARKLLPGDTVKYMGSLYSDTLAMFVIMPTFFALALLMADDDDDFEWSRFLQMYTRKTFLGWGPTYTMDLFMNLGRVITDAGFGWAQYGTKVISPALGLPIIENIIRGGAEVIDDFILE